MGIKLLYRSLRDEQQMEELKRQNLQAEMDYLRYQITFTEDSLLPSPQNSTQPELFIL